MIDLTPLLAITFGLYLLGIVAVLLLPKKMTRLVLAAFGGLGSLALLAFGIRALFANSSYHASLWSIPSIGKLTVAVDHLSAFFLVVAGMLFIAVSLFSCEYLRHYCGRINLKAFSFSYFALLASVSAIPITGDVFSFLIAWEAMSLLCYLLVNTEHESDAARQASYLMLAIGEAGTLAIAVSFIILSNAAGSTSFSAIKVAAPGLSPGLHWMVFLLSFFGFATKVGLVPVNFWLPRAHPVAPANISALLSGLILNLGLYGILRVNFDIMPIVTSGPGVVVLVVGAISALVGILYATIENDMKKILAHSSIENMGIICVGLGAGSIFRTSGYPVYASIALIAAIYHMVNHSMYKGLLFMGAGVVDTHAGSRHLDRLGGLLKRMPWTGFFILVGVLSISAMPPFNGFVSEWLTLESLLRSVELASLGLKIVFVAAGVALALTAGLAVTCFVRAFAMGFLGMPRSETAGKAHETGKPALLSMAFLAFVCLVLGVLPTYVIPTVDRVVAPLAGASATSALVPPFFEDHPSASELPREFAADFHDLGAQVGKGMMPGRGLAVIHRGGRKNPVVFAMSTSYMLIALTFLLGACVSIVWLVVARHRRVERHPRWDGGVGRFLPEMTYTATGFAQPVRVIFEAILRPKIVDRRETIAEHFRVSIQRERQEVHLVDRLVLYPLVNIGQRIASVLARMHNGQLNTYAGYALLTLMIFLAVAL